MELEFYGAAGEVTGSCHILRVGGTQLLLDCGMIQGSRDAPARNRAPLPFEPRAIDAVILSHAHLDHCGRLPLLAQRGFRGPVYTNAACRDLLPILFKDSAMLAARDAERTNRHRRDDDEPLAEPLYSLQDVEQLLSQVRTLRYDERRELTRGVVVRVRDAGHIMGSSSIELWLTEGVEQRKLVFSGDLGQYGSPILIDPHRFEAADLVLMECTYGNRRHRDRAATERELGEIVQAAADHGGNILIPAFAIGRSQDLLYLFGKYFEEWDLARWQIFLDSPMAIEASEVYWNHDDRYDTEARRLRAEFSAMPPLPNLKLCRTAEESRAINRFRGGAIVIAGSGMCNGGRILHHLKQHIENPNTHVVIAGFQPPGTLGRLLVDRVPEVRIHGKSFRVAAKVHTLGGLSAHGDQDDLLRWYSSFASKPPVYLVHGEAEGADGMQEALTARGTLAGIAKPGQRLELAQLEPLSPRESDLANSSAILE